MIKIDGLVDGSHMGTEEGALLKLGLLEVDDEGLVEGEEDGIELLGATETQATQRASSLAQWARRRRRT